MPKTTRAYIGGAHQCVDIQRHTVWLVAIPQWRSDHQGRTVSIDVNPIEVLGASGDSTPLVYGGLGVETQSGSGPNVPGYWMITRRQVLLHSRFDI
jgi:hypothetical protein